MVLFQLIFLNQIKSLQIVEIFRLTALIKNSYILPITKHEAQSLCPSCFSIWPFSGSLAWAPGKDDRSLMLLLKQAVVPLSGLKPETSTWRRDYQVFFLEFQLTLLGGTVRLVNVRLSAPRLEKVMLSILGCLHRIILVKYHYFWRNVADEGSDLVSI